ncbi:MAG TPA: hypothetical protein VF518_10680, partial [Polyangia bacterium]
MMLYVSFRFRSWIPLVVVGGLHLLACRPGTGPSSPSAGATGKGGQTADGEAGSGAGAGGNSLTPPGGSSGTGVGGSILAGTGGRSGGTGAVGITAAGTSAAGAVNPLPPNKVMTCDTPALAVPTQHIEAECAFGATSGNCKGTSGGQQGTQLENSSTDVGFIEGGDALWYSDVAMDGITTLTLHYAKGVDGGKVEVLLDGVTG